MADSPGSHSYGDDEPSKTTQAEQSKPTQAPVSTPAPVVAAAQSAAPITENNVPATSYAQEATPIPTVAQKAVDPRAPPPSQPTPVNQQPVKIENPYAIEEEADTYSGWDAAMGGSNGNDNGAYGGYGYDGAGGAGGYGDGQVSGSPAIKEDGCVFILYFFFYVCTVRVFYEARGGTQRLGLVSRHSSMEFSWLNKGSERKVKGIG